MNHPVLLVPHQEIYLQSWKNFPEIRWHMLVTGFGGGKTRANVILTLMLVRELQGMKDRAGDFARLCVAGYTYSHLEKTFLLYFRSYLEQSKTEYREDTKNHIFYVGTVTIIFLAMDNPELIFGQDVVACFDVLTKVLTRTYKGAIMNVTIGKLKEGDQVWTRSGWKKVLAVHDNGWKDCIKVHGVWCTPDHRWASGSDWIPAENISSETSLCKLGIAEVQTCQNIESVQKTLLQILRNLTESGITDTRNQKTSRTGIITELMGVSAITLHYGKNITDQFLKEAVCTIETSILLTTLLIICSLLQELNTIESMQPSALRKGGTKLKKEERQWLQQLKKLVKQGNSLADVLSVESLLWEITARLSSALRSARKNAGSSCSSRGISRGSDIRLCASIVEKLLKPSEMMQFSVQDAAKMLTTMLMDLQPDRSLKHSDVSYAEKSLCGQEQGIRPQLAPNLVPSRRLSKRKHVYDITVEDCHEYFVGGSDAYYCVHNCIQEESDELPEATLMEACKALSERTRQQIIGFRSPFICLGTTSQGESGLYRLYCQFKKKGTGFVLIRGRTQDNFYLPKEQIIDLYKMYDDVERRVFLEGEFLAVSRNRVFPGFDWARNYSDDDFDKYLKPGERVFIGQDVNCIGGDVLIETLRGSVPMRDVTTDDMVLTRKGYKQVLTKLFKGVKIVREYGGVTATPDHVAITPEGDMAICQARNLFCLKEQFTSDLEPIRRMMVLTSLLRWWLSMESSGEGTQVKKVQEGIIFTDTTQRYIDTYMKNLSDLYLKGCKSITSMDTMTTDLKRLCSYLWRSTQRCIRNCQADVMEGKPGRMQERLRRFWLIMLRKLEESITQGQERKTGRTASSNALLCALTAERSSQQIYQLLRDALSVKKNTEERLNGKTTTTKREELRYLTGTVLTEFVSSVESMLSEAVRQNIVKNTDIIGNVQGIYERNVEVFDIEVEGAHEFFANGVLVHNCGFSRATAWVAREGVMHCLKRYSFPDVADAPDVFRYDFPDQDIFWIPDVTTKDSYPQYARALRKNNIHIIHRSKNPIVEDTAFLVSVLCKNGRIMFHKMARDAADAVARAVRDKDGKIGKGKSPSDWQHDGDTVRYACSYMALVLPDFRDIRQSLITHIASLRREVEKDEPAPVRKLAAGYTQIDPAAFFKR